MTQRIHRYRLVSLLLTPCLITVLGIFPAASARSQEHPGTTVLKRIPVQQNGEISGARLFQNYCAPCHGVDAKGNSPAAPALKSVPPDLTVLAKYRAGNFPADHIMSVLTGQGDNTAHGSKDMPVWGAAVSQYGRSIGRGRLSARQKRRRVPEVDPGALDRKTAEVDC